MEEDVQFLLIKEHKLKKVSKTNIFNQKATIDGSITLNSESKLPKILKYISV